VKNGFVMAKGRGEALSQRTSKMSVVSCGSDALASRVELLDIIINAFGRTPTQSTFAFQMVRSMWSRCRSRFVITGGLHQNSMTDPLHFSVSVDIADGWKNYIHFNGFYNNHFILQNITMMTVDFDKNTIVEIIATY